MSFLVFPKHDQCYPEDLSLFVLFLGTWESGLDKVSTKFTDFPAHQLSIQPRSQSSSAISGVTSPVKPSSETQGSFYVGKSRAWF